MPDADKPKKNERDGKDPKGPAKLPDAPGTLAAVGVAASTGLQMAGGAVAGLLLGRWFDSWAGTSPWGLVLGIFFGLIAGFWGVYKRLTGSG